MRRVEYPAITFIWIILKLFFPSVKLRNLYCGKPRYFC